MRKSVFFDFVSPHNKVASNIMKLVIPICSENKMPPLLEDKQWPTKMSIKTKEKNGKSNATGMLVGSTPSLRREPPDSAASAFTVDFFAFLTQHFSRALLEFWLRCCEGVYYVKYAWGDFGRECFKQWNGLETFFHLGFYFAHGSFWGSSKKDKTL